MDEVSALCFFLFLDLELCWLKSGSRFNDLTVFCKGLIQTDFERFVSKWVTCQKYLLLNLMKKIPEWWWFAFFCSFGCLFVCLPQANEEYEDCYEEHYGYYNTPFCFTKCSKNYLRMSPADHCTPSYSLVFYLILFTLMTKVPQC